MAGGGRAVALISWYPCEQVPATGSINVCCRGLRLLKWNERPIQVPAFPDGASQVRRAGCCPQCCMPTLGRLGAT